MTSVTEEMIEAAAREIATGTDDWPENWVEYSGIARAALEAALSASPAAQTEVGKYTPAQRKVYDTLAEQGGGTWAAYVMLDIEAAFAPSAPQPTEPVAVKPLQWHTFEDEQRAITVCGMYAVSPQGNKLRLTGMPGELFGKFDSMDAAKAAAQADFERRILSALASPVAQQRDEVIEAKAKLSAVWAVLEDYRRRHDPHNGDCEVCGLIRRTDAALLDALSPERKDQSNG